MHTRTAITPSSIPMTKFVLREPEPSCLNSAIKFAPSAAFFPSFRIKSMVMALNAAVMGISSVSAFSFAALASIASTACASNSNISDSAFSSFSLSFGSFISCKSGSLSTGISGKSSQSSVGNFEGYWSRRALFNMRLEEATWQVLMERVGIHGGNKIKLCMFHEVSYLHLPLRFVLKSYYNRHNNHPSLVFCSLWCARVPWLRLLVWPLSMDTVFAATTAFMSFLHFYDIGPMYIHVQNLQKHHKCMHSFCGVGYHWILPPFPLTIFEQGLKTSPNNSRAFFLNVPRCWMTCSCSWNIRSSTCVNHSCCSGHSTSLSGRGIAMTGQQTHPTLSWWTKWLRSVTHAINHSDPSRRPICATCRPTFA